MEIDLDKNEIKIFENGKTRTVALDTPEGFSVLSKLWLRAGWETKHVYTFTWLGRPLIQLPEDMLRLQEVIYQLKPDVILETGVAHGGGLVFYASLCKLMEHGRVIGVDCELRSHNRQAMETHPLFPLITLIEGDSAAPETVSKIKSQIKSQEKVLVILDSDHTKKHVLKELRAYAPLVSKGSYIIAADGIMKDLAGASRTAPDWDWNNPYFAVQDFLREAPEFALEEPKWQFNESNGLARNEATYWPGAWLKKIK